MILFTAAIMAGTIASRSMNTYIVAAIENFVSIIIPLFLALPLIGKVSFQNQKIGIIASILVGIFVALYVITLTKSYALNKVAIVAPLVFGGAIFLSAVLSYFIFKEKFSFFQGVGLFFLAIGLIIITYARFSGK